MANNDWWLDKAKAIPEGSSRRYDCTCGTGRTMSISSLDNGWSAHCFRCKYNSFIPYGIRPLADLSIIRRAEVAYRKVSKTEEISLPDDFTQAIPSEYAVWFARNGITQATWQYYGCGWSQKLARIILPVFDGDTLSYIQCRAVEAWRKPKYLNVAATTASEVLFRSQTHHGVRTCCITEDIASAMRVGLYLPAVSTLGTILSITQASYIASAYDRAIVWYDSDKAGRDGDIQAKRTLRMLGIDCYSICTPLDPKGYSNQELLTILTKGEYLETIQKSYPKNAREAMEEQEKSIAEVSLRWR